MTPEQQQRLEQARIDVCEAAKKWNAFAAMNPADGVSLSLSRVVNDLMTIEAELNDPVRALVTYLRCLVNGEYLHIGRSVIDADSNFVKKLTAAERHLEKKL